MSGDKKDRTPKCHLPTKGCRKPSEGAEFPHDAIWKCAKELYDGSYEYVWRKRLQIAYTSGARNGWDQRANLKPSAESDEKLRDELADKNYHAQGLSKTAFKRGWNAARANPVEDPRVTELVDWLKEFRFAIKANDQFAAKEIALNWIDDKLSKFEGGGT